MATILAGDKPTGGALTRATQRTVGGRIATGAGAITGAITTTETTVSKLDITGVSIVSAQTYLIRAALSAVLSLASDSFEIRVRKDTPLTGTTVLQRTWITDVSGYTHTKDFSAPYIATATDNSENFYLSVKRIAGSGSATVYGDSQSCAWIETVDNNILEIA